MSLPRGSEPALRRCRVSASSQPPAGSPATPARPGARHVLPTHVEVDAGTARGHRDLLCHARRAPSCRPADRPAPPAAGPAPPQARTGTAGRPRPGTAHPRPATAEVRGSSRKLHRLRCMGSTAGKPELCRHSPWRHEGPNTGGEILCH